MPSYKPERDRSPLRGAKIDFDDIIDQVRQFGPFQWKVWVIASMFEAPAAMCMLFFIFGGANPGWQCVSPTNNLTQPMSPSNESLTSVEMCSLNSTQCFGHQYYEEFTSVVTEWDLVCDHQYIPTLITTCMMAGVGVGAAAAGQLADTYGRRHVFITVGTLAMIMETLQAFATSWQMFAAMRFLVGLFVGGTLVIGYVIPMEVVGRSWRTLCACLGAWNVGTMTLTLLGYYIRDWRYLSIATGLIYLPLAFTWFCLPESPRWLVQHNKVEEASAIIQQMARENKRPPPDLSLLEKINHESQRTSGDGVERKYSYHDLFRSRDLTKRTLIMLYLWFVCSVSFYGIAINMRDITENRYLNLVVMAILETFFNMSIIGTAKWFGRKKSLFGYMSLVSAAMITIVVCDAKGSLDDVPGLRMAVALMGRAGVSAAWGMGYLLSAELFPTVVRNLACAACSIAARVGGVVAPQIAYMHFIHPTIPYVCFCALAISCSLFVLLLPETRDLPLEDSLPDDSWCCFSSRGLKKAPSANEVELSGIKPNPLSC